MPQYLSIEQVCDMLHLSRSRLNQLRAAGEFPQPYKLSPGKQGRVIWPADAIHAWLAERAPKGKAA